MVDWAMTLVLTPLQASFGVEASGIDLAGAVSAADAEALRAALSDHLVLVVRGQSLTPAQYVNAMRIFGTPMRQHLTKLLDPDHPEIAILDSRVAGVRREGAGCRSAACLFQS